ncbi:MAG: hypothetical protein FWG02_05340 [Holophagaceae bacterium]|nr:hypothetical protein [Holophagaceae bacterium]
MRNFLKILMALMFFATAFAQSPLVERRMRTARFVNGSSSAFLLHIGEQSSSLYAGLSSLCKGDELLEMNLTFESVQTTSPVYSRFMSELRLGQNSLWALTDDLGRVLLQGSELPEADFLRQTLENAGIKSPVRKLRDFIKQHPNHIDARMHLLKILRNIAETRTMQTLQLDLKSMNNQGGAEVYYSIFTNSPLIDTSDLDEKTLSPQQDIKIWGPYAQEFDVLFNSGDWRFWNINNWFDFRRWVPVDACSPTVVQVYRRHISKVEEYLEAVPTNMQVWELYGWMHSIVKPGFSKSVLDRLIPPSDESTSWPYGKALGFFIAQEITRNNWDNIAETLWPRWNKIRLGARFQIGQAERINAGITSITKEIIENQSKGMIEAVLKDTVLPLVESLINANRIHDAETIILDLAKFPAYKDLQRRAGELALNCGREDVASQWAIIEIPEKPDKPDMDDVMAETHYYNTQTAILVIINGEASAKDVSTLINQNRVRKWELGSSILNPGLSELICQQMGWQVGVSQWALVDSNGRIIGHGANLPTEDLLCQTLEQNSIRTPAEFLHRFVIEHPNHFTAKINLLGKLKDEAEALTKEKIGKDAGVDDTLLLSDEDDQAIWGEYAVLCHSVITYVTEQASSNWAGAGYNHASSRYFIHSKKMKNLAPSLLEMVEWSLVRQPTNPQLWALWMPWSELKPNYNFTNFKETLVVSPESDPLDLPPSFSARWMMMREYHMRQRWQKIIDLQEWRLQVILADLGRYGGEAERLWGYEWQPLLEAYMGLEKDKEADELLKLWNTQSAGWQKTKESAIALANKHGRTALAERWAKL